MQRAWILVLFVSLAFPLFADPAEAPKKHPIEVRVDQLLEKDPSTHGQSQAFVTGLELWDKELNRVYQALIKALGTDAIAKKALQESQREWLKFRDLEVQWISVLYGKKEGTMFGPMAANDIMDITRRRAMELNDRLSILTDM